MTKKQSQLDKLFDLTSKAGIDGSALLEELSQAIISRIPPPVDETALIERTAVAVEARIGVKLAEVLEKMETSGDSNKPDSEAIIRGVAILLQPKLQEAAKQAAEATFAANAQSLKNQIQEKIQQKQEEIQQKQKEQANPANPSGDGAPGNLGFSDLARYLLANVDSIVKLIQALKPAPTPEVKAAELLGMSLRLADKIERVKSGQAQISELTKDIQDSLTKK